MSLEAIERIANAVLYEGYILYPYRASSVKNQRRFNFGVLVPPAYSAAHSSGEISAMRTECLVNGDSRTSLEVRVRFLQVTAGSWQNAVERQVVLGDSALAEAEDQALQARFEFPVDGNPETAIVGSVTVSAHPLEDGVFRLTVDAANETAMEGAKDLSRDEILPYSLAAAHTILAVRDGEFISLLDPPIRLREAAAACQNKGTWPVLAGDPGQRGCMLSSPIILYDYPQIAPESPGDLFDGTEIDEILTLRIMTLTDEEKQEIRGGDERARHILERTEMLPEEHFRKLHGAWRGLRPVEGSH